MWTKCLPCYKEWPFYSSRSSQTLGCSAWMVWWCFLLLLFFLVVWVEFFCCCWVFFCCCWFALLFQKKLVYGQTDLNLSKILKKKPLNVKKEMPVCLILNEEVPELSIYWYDLKFLLCSWEIFQFNSFRRPNYSSFGAYLVFFLLNLLDLDVFCFFGFFSPLNFGNEFLGET